MCFVPVGFTSTATCCSQWATGRGFTLWPTCCWWRTRGQRTGDSTGVQPGTRWASSASPSTSRWSRLSLWVSLNLDPFIIYLFQWCWQTEKADVFIDVSFCLRLCLPIMWAKRVFQTFQNNFCLFCLALRYFGTKQFYFQFNTNFTKAKVFSIIAV